MFIAGCLARDSYLLTSHNALDTTAELLGVDGAEAVAKLVADLPANGDGRAQVITLASSSEHSNPAHPRTPGAMPHPAGVTTSAAATIWTGCLPTITP